jgi:hypothetical protein
VIYRALANPRRLLTTVASLIDLSFSLCRRARRKLPK